MSSTSRTEGQEPLVAALGRARGVLFDLDGSIYSGLTACPGAAELVGRLKRQGVSVAFLSNNSTDDSESISAALATIDIDADPTTITTPTQVAGDFLLQTFGPDIGVVCLGSDVLCRSITCSGLRLLAEGATSCDVVLLGRDTSFSYHSLTRAVRLLADGARLVITNPDRFHPGEGGAVVPETGALAAAITAIVPCRPVVIGKPAVHLFRECLARGGLEADSTVLVGDNLETDVRGGNSLGITTVWYNPTRADSAAVSAATPDYVVYDYRELLKGL